ncbi:PAS domain S-box protein, partial [Mesorhizobium sp. BR1-1-7]
MEQGVSPAGTCAAGSQTHETRCEAEIPDLVLSSELDDFFENAAVGLHLVANDGTILRANRAELDMLGYSADEYIGRNIREFHADSTAIEDILSRLSRHERLQHYRARLRAKDGSVRWAEITSNVRAIGGRFLNTRCITIDVTEKVKTEELLLEQEQRLALTYDSAGTGIVETDAEGRLLRVNAHLCNLLGYT